MEKETAKPEQEQVVKIDYEKLIVQFGCERIDESIIDRVARLTGRPAHSFLRRNIFLAHRDLNKILDGFENGEKFYLYTRMVLSSEPLQLGDLVPLIFTKYLQDAFKVPLVIQLSDDECYKLPKQERMRLTRERVKDILACGFDVSRTFIYSESGYVGGAFYENMTKIQKCVTYNMAADVLGLTGEDDIVKVGYPSVQAAAAFPSSFPHLFSGKDKLGCLISCAIDQDPFFRVTRDVAPRLGYNQPALIESVLFPPIQGESSGKLSARDAKTAICVTDLQKDIKKKVNKYALSGGQDSIENHRKYGANLEVDIPFKYLNFFLDDDKEVDHIKMEYGSGRMLTGEVKKILIAVLSEVVATHQARRAAVTDEILDVVMAVRPLPCI